MLYISESEYNDVHTDFRGVWSTDRSDIPGWKPEKYMGKRTLMDDCALSVEDLHFKIVPNPLSTLKDMYKDGQPGRALEITEKLYEEKRTLMQPVFEDEAGRFITPEPVFYGAHFCFWTDVSNRQELFYAIIAPIRAFQCFTIEQLRGFTDDVFLA